LRAYWQLFGLKVLLFFVNWPTFFSSLVKNRIIYNFVIFVATKKAGQIISFHPSLAVFYPGWTKIRIRNPG
jgi:hypothetical protein